MILGIIFIFLAFVLILVTVLNFSILFALIKDKDLKILKKLNSFKDRLSILFYILLLISGVFYLLKSFITLDLKVIVYLLLTCIIGVILSRIIKNNKYNSAIASFVAIAICGLIFPQVQMDNSLFESSTVKTKITNYEKDIKDTTCTYPQLDVLIKKDKYKDEIFKYIIIKTEHDTRDNQNFEKAVNTKSNVSWDSNKTQYVHYEKAIQSFNKKGNTYTNKDYQIVVTKNNIKTTYIGSR